MELAAKLWLKGVNKLFGLASNHCERATFGDVERQVGPLGKSMHPLEGLGLALLCLHRGG